MYYQELFDYMSKEHGVTLLETDMQEICRIVNHIQNNKIKTCLICNDLLGYWQPDSDNICNKCADKIRETSK